MFHSSANPMMRSAFAEQIFNQKYRHPSCETWAELAHTLVEGVCGGLVSPEDCAEIEAAIREMKMIPGGRYLYYAGRKKNFYNNCYVLMAEEDSREDWAKLSWQAESCLLTGGGIGVDYSAYREAGATISGTGGVASGPIPKMMMINEIGRHVMQGGSRRSALYGSLNWAHPDAKDLLTIKDWDWTVPGTNLKLRDLKRVEFNWPCPLDMTNISLNYDDVWLNKVDRAADPTFLKNVRQAMHGGEPGFSFNFGEKQKETGRNACTELTSADDSDVCNLLSINWGRIDSAEELSEVTALGTMFVMCGAVRADLPYKKIHKVRAKNNRIGVGLMGLHEWMIKSNLPYDVSDKLGKWLGVWEQSSLATAAYMANKLSIAVPKGTQAIAPTGTIGLIADTSTGIEPLFAVAYKRRFLKGTSWHYSYVVDATAKHLIDAYGTDPEKIETALSLSSDIERRIRLQAFVQDHVDMAIASTINVPAWGTESNNEDRVEHFADIIAKYAPRLRGLTVYPDGARGGQPLTICSYDDAKHLVGEVYSEEHHDVCDISGKGGSCGS